MALRFIVADLIHTGGLRGPAAKDIADNDKEKMLAREMSLPPSSAAGMTHF